MEVAPRETGLTPPSSLDLSLEHCVFVWKRKEKLSKRKVQGVQSTILIRVISASHYFLETSNGHIYSKEMPGVWLHQLQHLPVGGEEGEWCLLPTFASIFWLRWYVILLSSVELILFRGTNFLPLSLFGCQFPLWCSSTILILVNSLEYLLSFL